ncbi:MAG: MerR family transcriptional regulator [Gammaproteobacteria bacterium]
MSTIADEFQKKAPTTFKIGAVSRITNIPVDTLRIWERRYSVVVPIRSENSDRLYQREDINRLTLLKMLVDRGHSIGSIAKLSNEELVERLDIHDQNNAQVKQANVNNIGKSVSVAVIGDVLPLQLEHNQIEDSRLDFVGLYNSQDEYMAEHKGKPVDILIVEYPAIHEDKLAEIDELYRSSGAGKMLLVYGFTNSAAKRLLNNSHYNLVPAPITVEHLHAEIKHLIENTRIQPSAGQDISITRPAPTRLYSNKQLIKLSSASSTIKCECPQHLSSLILKLVQFEVYSEQCENRGLKDAELHAMLGKMTGHARAIMETALTEVVKAEGLDV